MKQITMRNRFRGYLPVIVDVETAGFNPKKDALLEIASFTTSIEDNKLVFNKPVHFHVQPFKGANLDADALKFTGIDPYHPFRFSVSEREAFEETFDYIRRALKKENCSKAVLVGHNAFFDLSFVIAASKRVELDCPFHKFTTFDTATLGGLAYGQTVLSRALNAAKIEFDEDQAHSALYDAEKTSELFCKIVNTWQDLIGFPIRKHPI